MKKTSRSAIGSFFVLLSSFLLLGLSPLTALPVPPIPEAPPFEWKTTLQASASFYHQTGRAGSRGWDLDHREHREGYALSGLRVPLLLSPGLYRATFVLRRGNYPAKGLLHGSYALFRIEIWDLAENDIIAQRELQIADFPEPNAYVPRWMTFSTQGRGSNPIEAKVYWFGLANGEIDKIEISRHQTPDLKKIHAKAESLGRRLEANHLENGYVVPRKPTGEPDEIGDAITYTAFYAAALAWRQQTDPSPLALQSLQNVVQTLRTSIVGPDDDKTLVRFIDENEDPHPKSPSKDVYLSFFYGAQAAHDALEPGALRDGLQKDVYDLGIKFLEDNLTVTRGDKTIMSLAPHFTEYEIKNGINKLYSEKDGEKEILDGLQTVQRLIPFTELFPSMKEVIRALKKKDQERLFSLVLPTLNGLANLIERVRDILREQFRQDLFPLRQRNDHYPGRRLESLLTFGLNNMPPKMDRSFGIEPRFKRISDFRILASNALISLHIVKTAEQMTQKSAFEEYYKNNLYSQDHLLQTALDWHNFEEDFVALTAGNPAADRLRKGYLGALALHSLLEQERNPHIRATYAKVLEDWWIKNRHEDNPLAAAFQARSLQIRGVPQDDPQLLELQDFILRALHEYPEEPRGFGDAYWERNDKKVAGRFGGGEVEDYAREPLPITHRPRDSFLWQRNPRRLSGDFRNDYPGNDYLFLYWFSRKHGLIPDPEREATVFK